ncbi:hypothetical protein [Legionella cincinnatiensis]|uniref:CopG-like ribbon-helix-helix domain-containing protein n=1 Tax=Legionella cincinnatiensis TaxID=28085 RepID=A0A378IKV0_9GAMM|nr:hypothetical protein [Legionella cincinnatiensis]KTC78707.1 hypothetical protein Lcin_3322 [Legionella cincinnatiensis]STX35295.1 Uncharacterised protein [Legionella cincinnatiensis]
MSRLTISLPNNLHNRIASLAIKNNDSMSHMINLLIQVGLNHWFEKSEPLKEKTAVEKHCHQLIIQMNALIKNMSAELLKLNRDDFDKLQQGALMKYNELQNMYHENA